MKKLAIIGLGLMGGSLGLAVKRRRLARVVHGYARRPANRRQAERCGAVDKAWDAPEEAVRDADMVVLCLPVLAIPDFLKMCRPWLKPGCVVTDVGSTKAELVRKCRWILSDGKAFFVGSHPIAGSEESGIGAARADLYEGATTVLTPPNRRSQSRDQRAMRQVKQLWMGVGARVVVMTPGEHDRLIAKTSHLPHLVAAMLVSRLGRSSAKADDLCGPGFRDATRIAAGSEDLWHDIVKTNRGPVARELRALTRVMGRVSKMVGEGDFEELRRFLAGSRKKRRDLNSRLEQREALP